MKQLKPGLRLKSAVCNTEVMVIKAPAEPVSLTCGGVPMLEGNEGAAQGTLLPDHANGTQIGKRYVDTEGTMEILCTKAGQGSLAADEAPLGPRESRALPSSD